MNVDPTTATIALGALVVIAALVGMFVGAFWGLRRIVADVVRSEFGWLAEWKSRVDEERAQARHDASDVFTRLRMTESDIAGLKAARK